MRRLNADEIECRVSQVTAKGCSLLLYKTARVDRAILDETFGELWQNDFKVINGNMYGGIGVYNKELKDWLWRWDCGTESMTEKEKGEASDSFKRACFKWGIGVELYSAPFIFIQCATSLDEEATKKRGKKTYKLDNQYAKYSVKEIGYSDNGEINKLVIIDDKGTQVYKHGSKITSSNDNPVEPPKENTVSPNPDDDLDLLQGLYDQMTTKSAESYYKTFKCDAVNPELFKSEYAKHYLELKKAGK